MTRFPHPRALRKMNYYICINDCNLQKHVTWHGCRTWCEKDKSGVPSPWLTAEAPMRRTEQALHDEHLKTMSARGKTRKSHAAFINLHPLLSK